VPRWGALATLTPSEIDPIVEDTVQLGRQLWDRMTSPTDPTPLGHDGYLKLWALSKPRLEASYILLDEAQDTNAVVLDVLGRQSGQMVYVGDRYQQIYEWRGAINAMEQVVAQHERYLTLSFRFGSSIATAASKLLSHLGEHRTISGNPQIASTMGCPRPDAILCRTNSAVLGFLIQAIEAGERPHVIGGTEDLLRMLDGVADLKAGKPSSVPEFFGFSTWPDLLAFVDQEEGQGLRSFVRLVDRYGECTLRRYVGGTSKQESEASLIISTAHKAKGREWPNVFVASDFVVVSIDKDGKKNIDPSELRLLYVAMTRARLRSEIPQDLATLFGIIQQPGGFVLKGRPERSGNERQSDPRPAPTGQRSPPSPPVQPVQRGSFVDRLRSLFFR
jgi:hypothetical protein